MDLLFHWILVQNAQLCYFIVGLAYTSLDQHTTRILFECHIFVLFYIHSCFSDALSLWLIIAKINDHSLRSQYAIFSLWNQYFAGNNNSLSNSAVCSIVCILCGIYYIHCLHLFGIGVVHDVRKCLYILYHLCESTRNLIQCCSKFVLITVTNQKKYVNAMYICIRVTQFAWREHVTILSIWLKVLM